MSEAPKHYYIDERYDKCIDLSLRRVVYGGLAGALAALVLFSECCSATLIPTKCIDLIVRVLMIYRTLITLNLAS